MHTSLIDRRVYWITTTNKLRSGLVRAVGLTPEHGFRLLVEMDDGTLVGKNTSDVSTAELRPDAGASS
jgi:hypothetical protein